MEKEEKTVIEAISDILANAIGDETFVLPLAAWQTKAPASDEINAAYAAEIKAYRQAPIAHAAKRLH